MNNFLENGSVLPFGLLGDNLQAALGGFNKSYNNSYLRVGVIVQAYDVSDSNNRSKLTTEYDVSVIEQNQDIGATSIIYKNCMSVDGLGSIPDFLEKTFRKLEKKTTSGSGINLKGQNGAIVLLLCLDGMSDKGIIVGGFPHPDRPTTLTSDGPMLQGEFNGVNLKVNVDGSTGITFNGPTDNNGDLIDPIAGPTNINIENDGSFEIKHSTITFRLDKGGAVTVTAEGSVSINCESASVTAATTANVTAEISATVEARTVNLGKNASEAAVLGDTFKKFFDNHIHPTAMGPSGQPTLPIPQIALSRKVVVE